MAKRSICIKCKKAMDACICPFISFINNDHFLHIFQDPSEEKKAIGTARILALSLNKVELTVGELFDETLFDLANTYLVFPGEASFCAKDLRKKNKIKSDTSFILLDGSWKKAYKILMSNPWLQSLPKISFSCEIKSDYRIRKSSVANSLSTVEAAYHLLSELEENGQKFQPLLYCFNEMINFQISKMPAEIYKKNHLDK